MKSLVIKVFIIIILVVFLGSGILRTVDYIEDLIITTTVDLIESSEFIYEIRSIVQDVVRDVVSKMDLNEFYIQPVTVP